MATKKTSTSAEEQAFLAEAEFNLARAENERAELARHKLADEFNVINAQLNTAVALQKLCYDYSHGYFELDDDISHQSAAALLMNLRIFTRQYPGRDITIEMNSPGGSIIDGFRLYDELLRFRAEGHHLTVRVRGMAASMAGVILQAGDVREIGPSAFVMIHRAGFGAAGKAYEVEDEVEFVRMLEDRIVDIFAERSGNPRDTFTGLFKQRKDVWLSANKALEMGLVDAIR
jgi:ATP-dependent Clp endopeptidase proteolytic subunit ClpP